MAITGHRVNTAKTFEASIRPIQVQTITLSSDDANLNLTLAAQTYYQPQKHLTYLQR